MFHPLRVLCLLACVAGWSIPAAAQAVWRCGDTYSQNPCPGGKPVAAQDARDAGQRAQTDGAVRRDARVADEMERSRLKEEGKPAPAYIPAAKGDATGPEDDRTRSVRPAKRTADFGAIEPRKPRPPKEPKKPAGKKKKAKKSGATAA